MSDFPEITEAQRLTLKPGDILVLHVESRISQEEADMIRSRMLPQLPDGVKLMVLEKDMSLEVAENVPCG